MHASQKSSLHYKVGLWIFSALFGGNWRPETKWITKHPSETSALIIILPTLKATHTWCWAQSISLCTSLLKIYLGEEIWLWWKSQEHLYPFLPFLPSPPSSHMRSVDVAGNVLWKDIYQLLSDLQDKTAAWGICQPLPIRDSKTKCTDITFPLDRGS